MCAGAEVGALRLVLAVRKVGQEHAEGVEEVSPFQGYGLIGFVDPGLRFASPWAGVLRPVGAAVRLGWPGENGSAPWRFGVIVVDWDLS